MDPSALSGIPAAQISHTHNMPFSVEGIEGIASVPEPFADDANNSDCLEDALNLQSDSPVCEDLQHSSRKSATGPETEQTAQVSAQPDSAHQQVSGSLWLQKHPLPPPKAVGKPAPASPTSSGDSKAAGAKRKNLFPKIRASERCGQCENCLNPQRKKACIEARRRQQERLGQHSLPHPAKQHKTQSGAATSRAPPAPSDPWADELGRVLDHSGGVVQAKHVPTVLHLMKSAKSILQRFSLCAVLQRSAPEVLHALVKHQALLVLQAWLVDSINLQKPKLASRVLGCLAKLPVTTASLQPPCELGKLVGKLRKEPGMDQATQEAAKQLVAKWKKTVEEESKRGTAAPSSNPAPAAANGAPPSKPATPAVPASKPTFSSAKPAAAKPVFAAVEDDDMFGAADKQRAHVKEAAAQHRKVMRIEVEPTRGRSPGAAATGEEVPATSHANDTAPAAAAAEASSSASGQAHGSAPAPIKAEASKASSSPFEGLGGFSTGVSMIGGASSSLTLSSVVNSSRNAAARAAEAARRVPSPEPPKERRAKAKKVAWVGDTDMVAVRWFRKVDPPVAAQSDVDLNAAPTSSSDPGDVEAVQRESSPPGFESAAKKEHLSEAQALRAHRIQEDEERLELETRLHRMLPAVPWSPPPPMAAASRVVLTEVGVAQGEESAERVEQQRRRTQREAEVYPTLDDVPPTPREPEIPSDQGESQHLDKIPKIPLSVEEAQALLQQVQSLQQAQQQGQLLLGLPPPAQAQPQAQLYSGQQQGAAPVSTEGVHLIHAQPQPQQLPFSQPMTLPTLPSLQQPQHLQQLPPKQPHGSQPISVIDSSALAQLASSGLLQLQPGFQLGGQPPQQAQQPNAIPQHLMQPPQHAQQGPAGLGPPPFQPHPPPQPMQGPPGGVQLLQQQGGSFPPGQFLVQGGQLPPAQHHHQQQQQPPWQGAQQAQQQQQQGGPLPHHRNPPRHAHDPPPQQRQRPHEGGGGTRRIPCRFFNTTGCKNGDNCRFAHIPQEGDAGSTPAHRQRPPYKRGRGEDGEGGGYEGQGGRAPLHKQPRTWDSRGPGGGRGGGEGRARGRDHHMARGERRRGRE